MGRVKKNTKQTRSFGASRSKRKRGRKKVLEAVLMKQPECTRRAKCSTAQKDRVEAGLHGANVLQAKAKAASATSSQDDNSEVKTGFSKKLEYLVNISGVHSPAEHCDDDAPEYGFVDIQCMNKIMAEAPEVCPECDCRDRVFIHLSGDDNGFAMRLVLRCQDCQSVLAKGFSSCRIEGPHSAFDVNKQSVFAMRVIGCTYSEINKFSVYMNMPGSMHHTTHITTMKTLEKELSDTIVETLRFYGDVVKAAHEQNQCPNQVFERSVSAMMVPGRGISGARRLAWGS
jgi:hypothetical protein